MKKLLLSSLLAASASALLAPAVYAQRGAFQVGPTAGATLASVHTGEAAYDNATTTRWGLQAGLTGRWQGAGHWAAQAAVLFVQQGYQRYDQAVGAPANSHELLRLNYLRLPLLATFSPHAGGQGLQLAAGPYVGVLLGGRYTYEATSQGSAYGYSVPVTVADSQTQPAYSYSSYYGVPDYSFYSRRFDVGVQGGVGYQLGGALLQLGYTLGLRNLATTTIFTTGSASYSSAGEPYRTRGWQVSLTYLLGGHGS